MSIGRGFAVFFAKVSVLSVVCGRAQEGIDTGDHRMEPPLTKPRGARQKVDHRWRALKIKKESSLTKSASALEWQIAVAEMNKLTPKKLGLLKISSQLKKPSTGNFQGSSDIYNR